MSLTSNLGVQGEFAVEIPGAIVNKDKDKPQTKPITSNKEDMTEIFYDMDIKPS